MPSDKQAQVTSADIAKALGVSRSTVSRAFSPGAYVNAALREKILSKSRELGYSPNLIARALITRESPIVGIVMHGFANPFHAEIYAHLTRQLQREGMTHLTAQIQAPHEVEEALSLFAKYGVRRVVLTSFAVTEDVLEACLASRLDVVLLNRADALGRTPAVCADLAQGGMLAAEHAVARGRNAVAIIDGVAHSWTATARAEGYLRGLSRHDLKPVLRVQGDYTYEGGLAAARALLDARPRPDVALCGNDLSAFGLIDGLRQAGVRVPDDVAVIGFDDVPMADWGAYALTTVRLPIESMASRTAQILGALGRGDALEPELVFMPCRLVVRDTC